MIYLKKMEKPFVINRLGRFNDQNQTWIYILDTRSLVSFLVNHEILEQIDISNRNCLYMTSNEIIKEVYGKNPQEYFKWSYLENELREDRVEISIIKYTKVVKMN
uniref:Uncharacterized protein n=1 Tax=Solanum lycopersicum TaxID=4081 RepID=A0A3Q7EE53_SOLLC